MEGGRIRFSGLASELRDHPDRLKSAYLLRGSDAKPLHGGDARPLRGEDAKPAAEPAP